MARTSTSSITQTLTLNRSNTRQSKQGTTYPLYSLQLTIVATFTRIAYCTSAAECVLNVIATPTYAYLYATPAAKK